MYIIFLDTETSGLNPAKHRILEIAYKIIDAHTGSVLTSYESIISQTPEVWAQADLSSLKFTNFKWEEILRGKTEKSVASEIENDFNHFDVGHKEAIFMCQNPSFDRAFFDQLINTDLQMHYGWPYHWLDLASMFWTIRLLYHENPRKESDLCKDEIAKYYGLAPEASPHRAMNGVNHLIACYDAIFKASRNH